MSEFPAFAIYSQVQSFPTIMGASDRQKDADKSKSHSLDCPGSILVTLRLRQEYHFAQDEVHQRLPTLKKDDDGTGLIFQLNEVWLQANAVT